MNLVAAEREHIPSLAGRMRAFDVKECAAFGFKPDEALRNAMKSSLWALTALVDGEPHAMIGVASQSMIASEGVPWMLGSERIYRHGRDLATYAPRVIAAMHETFDRLENVVAEGNDRAIRFLRHFDFEIYGDALQVGGVSFVRFRRHV